MATVAQAFITQDIEYLRHGERELMLTLFKPAGDGPFPFVVDLHGGAWNNGGRKGCFDRDGVLAEAGIAAAALDFRQAGDGYPTTLLDINYALRWLKANAAELGLDPDRAGITGQSSGGHLAMLAAMRPEDARYASIPLEGNSSVDARVSCVGMLWPVINPLSRYRHALRQRKLDPLPKWIGDIPENHDRYWRDEATMEEGNPMLALERGENVEMPPAVWIQGRPDIVHDYRDLSTDADVNEPERFVRNYRNAGGEIELVVVAQENRSSRDSFDPLAAFFRKHLT